MSRSAPVSKERLRFFWSRRLRRHLSHLPALIVWAAAVAATTALYLRQERGLTIPAVASEVRYVVAPSEPGRLERLEVGLGQDVEKGEIVASLEDRDLLLGLREARAEMERLSLQVARKSESLARDAESAVLGHLEALAEQAEDRIRLQGLELALRPTGPGAATDVDRTAFCALEKVIAEREPWIEKLEVHRRIAECRYEEHARAAPAGGEGSS